MVEAIKYSPEAIKPFTTKDVRKQLTLLTREEELLHTLIMRLQRLLAFPRGKKAAKRCWNPPKSSLS